MIRLVLAALLGGCQYVFPLAESPVDAGNDGSAGAAGDLDKSFAGRGWRTSTYDISYGRAVAVAADGTVTAVGFNSVLGTERCVILQLDAAGTPTGFGMNGEVLLSVLTSCIASGVSIYEGKVIIAGTSNEADVMVTRFLPDGELDPSFDGDGVAVPNVGAVDYADDVFAGSDGIVLAGGEGPFGESPGAMLTMRLRPDGSLDPTWNGNGIARPVIDPETAGISLAARPDILIAGTTQYFGAVVRMTAVGELDPLFGSAGLQRLGDNAVRNVAYGIAQRANGSMIVGVQRLVGATTNTDVFALDASGTPDPSFNNGAPLTIDFGVSAQVVQLALQDDGKIVVAATLEGATHNEIGLARVTAAGTLDATFGVGGIVSSRPEGTASYQVEDVVFAADRIVVVGTQTELNGSPVLFIARYLP